MRFLMRLMLDLRECAGYGTNSSRGQGRRLLRKRSYWWDRCRHVVGRPAKRSLSTISATAGGMIASDRCQLVRFERSYGQGGAAPEGLGL